MEASDVDVEPGFLRALWDNAKRMYFTGPPGTMEASDVDIVGLWKPALLRALWDNATPASFYASRESPTPPPFDEARAAEAWNDYVDYFQGRCIKADLSGDSVDPCDYDKQHGEGEFAKVVRRLRGACE